MMNSRNSAVPRNYCHCLGAGVRGPKTWGLDEWAVAGTAVKILGRGEKVAAKVIWKQTLRSRMVWEEGREELSGYWSLICQN